MKLIRGLHNLPKPFECVVTIGNFDGVHLGHQALIQALIQSAQQQHLPNVVLFFEPMPREFFTKNKTPPATRIMSFRDKCRLLSQYPIDYIVCLPFNERLAHLSAMNFITEVLVASLGVKHIVIGDDFRFGHDRIGDIQLLQTVSTQLGFTVAPIKSVLMEGARVSSSYIRELMAAQNVALSTKLLGHPILISGRVIHGAMRGRQINVPTANIALKQISPLHGVFAVRVHGLQSTPLLGVANIGNRPTVDGSLWLLEVHIFDFDQSIYHQHIQVEFCHAIRREKKFASFDELTTQIHADIIATKKYFSHNAPIGN